MQSFQITISWLYVIRGTGTYAQTLAAGEDWEASSDFFLGDKQAPKKGVFKVAGWLKIRLISTKPSQTSGRGMSAVARTTLKRSICKLELGQQGW